MQVFRDLRVTMEWLVGLGMLELLDQRVVLANLVQLVPKAVQGTLERQGRLDWQD